MKIGQMGERQSHRREPSTSSVYMQNVVLCFQHYYVSFVSVSVGEVLLGISLMNLGNYTISKNVLLLLRLANYNYLQLSTMVPSMVSIGAFLLMLNPKPFLYTAFSLKKRNVQRFFLSCYGGHLSSVGE